MEETTVSLSKMQKAIITIINAVEENMRVVEGMRRDIQAVLARLGGDLSGSHNMQPLGWKKSIGKMLIPWMKERPMQWSLNMKRQESKEGLTIDE